MPIDRSQEQKQDSKNPVKLTADLIYGFAGSLLSVNLDQPSPTPECHKEWWELFCSDSKRVAIAAPRGHAKSTALTKAFTLASVLFRVRNFVLIVSDTYKQATLFLGEIKRELAVNDDLRALFGVKDFNTDREDDIVIELNDGHKFRIMAVGSEQKVRGLIWNGKRPDLIMCDDMENDELVMNKERREKFTRWIYGALLPALSPKGIIRVVGTVLHLDSFLENLLPKPWEKETIREELKDWSLKTGKKNPWKSVRYRAHNEDFSEILWKDRFPKEELLRIRQDYTQRGIPDVYSQEYLNYPLDPSKAYFRKSDFVEMSSADKEDIKEGRKPLTYFIADDPAVSERERADFTAIIVAGMDANGNLYVVEGIKDRIDTKEHIDLLLNLYSKYNKLGGCDFIAIEKEKITKAIGPFLREEMLRRQLFPQIVEIQPSRDLEQRGRSWQGRMRIGSVKFDKSGDWYPTYEAELTTFPRGVKDDYVSASAIMGMALDRMVTAPTKEERDEDEYEEQYSIFLNQEGQNGRSRVTGY